MKTGARQTQGLGCGKLLLVPGKGWGVCGMGWLWDGVTYGMLLSSPAGIGSMDHGLEETPPNPVR